MTYLFLIIIPDITLIVTIEVLKGVIRSTTEDGLQLNKEIRVIIILITEQGKCYTIIGLAVEKKLETLCYALSMSRESN